MATNSSKTTSAKTATNGTKPEATEAKRETTTPTYSPDNIGHFAAAKQAEQDAYHSARIYAEIYCQTFDELKGRAILNLWQDKLSAGNNFDASQYIPDPGETRERTVNFAKQLAPQSTVVGLLPGQF